MGQFRKMRIESPLTDAGKDLLERIRQDFHGQKIIGKESLQIWFEDEEHWLEFTNKYGFAEQKGSGS